MKEIIDKCPNCGQEELRPIQLGNDRDGWQFTGEFECDNCDEVFTPFENHDCGLSEEDGCDCVKYIDAYQEYKNQEIRELNSR